MMKKILFLLCTLFLCETMVAQIPSVLIEDVKGVPTDIRDIVKDKITVLSFWSSTCKPCLTELDAINDVYSDWKKKADFQLIAVAIDDNRSIGTAKSLADGHAWEFTAYYDRNQVLKRAFNVNFIPQVFIFDEKGKQIYAHTGYTPGSEEEIINHILSLSTK